MGRATLTNQAAGAPPSSPPPRIWIGDFPATEGAVKRQGGILGAAEEIAADRPHLLGGGGLLGGEGPLERVPRGETPTSGWLVRGQLLDVDPGNRVQRA